MSFWTVLYLILMLPVFWCGGGMIVCMSMTFYSTGFRSTLTRWTEVSDVLIDLLMASVYGPFESMWQYDRSGGETYKMIGWSLSRLPEAWDVTEEACRKEDERKAVQDREDRLKRAAARAEREANGEYEEEPQYDTLDGKVFIRRPR
jgi:hypothetical protein